MGPSDHGRDAVDRSRPQVNRAPGGLAILLGLAALMLMGSGPPEVARVRVPTQRVREIFPPGTELRGLSTSAFEDLVRAARNGLEQRAHEEGPRLLQARHVARWEAGILRGRSELLVEGPAEGKAPLPLIPWSPAVDSGAETSETADIRIGEDGQVALWLDGPGRRAVTIAWELRARPGSDSRAFALGLPRLDTARLELDLPADQVPEGPRGIRRGPIDEADRKTWQFDGPGGPVDLQLRTHGGRGTSSPSSEGWVGGPTRIELDEATARWRADWTVDPGEDEGNSFVVQLDPGLEPVDVIGPAVVGFRAERAEGGTRVSVTLASEVVGPTPVSIRAQATVPTEGRWMIPAARPLDAIWTGGQTILDLDPTRELLACRELASRRVVPGPDVTEPVRSGGRRLVFEATAPRSAAELTFRPPVADVSAEVQGVLRLGREVPRFEALVTWRVTRGRLLALEVEVPAGWTPDQIRFALRSEPATWRAEPQPDGGTLLRIHPPPTMAQGESLTVRVSASAAGAGEVGPLALPRLRPIGVALADEIWTAQVEPGLAVRPVRARGLAWLDPVLLSQPAISASGSEAVRAREALAWRWTADDAAAEVERVRIARDPSGAAVVLATVTPGRLRLDLMLSIVLPEGGPREVPIHFSEPLDPAPEWHVAGDELGSAVPAREMTDPEQRQALGLPRRGSAWMLDLPQPRRGRVALLARLELPWSGRNRIPLLTLPERFQMRGTVLIRVDRALRTEARTWDLRALDPALAWRAASEVARPADDPRQPDPSRLRRDLAFGYQGPGGRLVLRTEGLEPVGGGGLIREALLTTRAGPGGPPHQRLALQIVPAESREIKVLLPRGASLERAILDGQPCRPVVRDRSLAFSLPKLAAQRTICSLVLDYAAPAGTESPKTAPIGDNSRLQPEAPTFSLPCLALGWEVALPEPWKVVQPGPALVPAEADLVSTWSHRLLGDWPWPWIPQSKASLAVQDTWKKDLDTRAAAAGQVAGATLGEILTRLDSSELPLIVDRWALAAAGWGPNSRPRPGRRSLSPGPEATRALLGPLSLSIRPLGGIGLVTTLAEPPGPAAGKVEEAESWSRILREAIAWGSDPSDRFQTVDRWRGEMTPQTPGTSLSLPAGAGWSIERFAAPGWPEAGAKVRTSEVRTQLARGWAIGLAILSLGVLGQGLAIRWRARGLAVALAGGLLAVAWASPQPSPEAAGAVCGALGTLAYWLGRGVRASRNEPEPSRRQGSTTIRVRHSTTEIGAGLVLAGLSLIGLLGQRLAADEETPIAPIIALIPFDGPPDPARSPDRVLLRLEDYHRLRSWAEAASARPVTRLAITGARHSVRLGTGVAAIVESRYELLSEGAGPVSWPLAVAGTREVSATLDDHDVPVIVEPGGRVARVEVAGAGAHRLVVRRTVDRGIGESGESIGLAIEPAATARVQVEPDPAGRTIEVPSARGSVSPAEGGGVEGLLGPTERLEVRWSLAKQVDRPTSRGSVEGQVLWDIEPAGDRVLARLTFRNPEGTARVRLALEPGLLVRSASVPGLIDAFWHGTAEHPEWLARIEPPLREGETLNLELWRPRTPSPIVMAGTHPVEVGITDRRSLPQFQPLGVERYSGLLGFRWTGDESGRVTEATNADPVTAAAFTASWGVVPPPAGLAVAGAARFLRAPQVQVETRALPPDARVQSDLHLLIQPGRVGWRVEAVLTDRRGRIFEVPIVVPEPLRLTRVEAEGLTSWNRLEPGRLLLRFDGSAAPRRAIRLEGWLPVDSDPLAVGQAEHQLTAYWPSWPGLQAEPGTLTASGPSSIRLEPSPGVERIAPPGDPTGRPPVQYAFRIRGPQPPGSIRWIDEPPRLDVTAQSLVTIHPDSAEWLASIRYQVSGGACDTIRLKVPTAWAEMARVDVEGSGHRLESTGRGSGTEWTLHLDQPIWGGRQVLIRSNRTLPPGESLEFPDVTPLGQGTVSTTLALANASGRPLVTEGTSGLEPIDPARFTLADLPGSLGVVQDAYRVQREGWSLRVRPGGEDPGQAETREAEVVTLADLACVLGADGSARGSARYELGPHPGPFLSVILPEGAEAVGAAVDANPVQPLRGGSGRWWVPLGDSPAGNVTLLWRAGPAEPGRDGSRPVPLPGLEQGRVPTLLTLRTPEALAPEAISGPFEPTAADTLEAERLERLGQRVGVLLTNLDRGSARARETLIAELARFQLRARDAERAARWALVDPGRTGQAMHQQALQRVEVARATLAEDLAAAGLDELDRTARERVGQESPGMKSTTGPLDIPTDPLRLRLPGWPHHFRGNLPGGGPSPSLRWSAGPVPRPWRRKEFLVLALIAAILLLALPALARVERRPIRNGLAALALAAITPALGLQPLALVAWLALFCAGWVSGRPGPAPPEITPAPPGGSATGGMGG